VLGVGEDEVDLGERLHDLREGGVERDGRELARLEKAQLVLRRAPQLARFAAARSARSSAALRRGP
jgi:hypothetical protein